VPNDVPDWTTGTDIPWVKLGTFTCTGVGAEGFDTTTAALAGVRHLGVLVENNRSIAAPTVVGKQSLCTYVRGGGPTQQLGWFTFKVNGARDSTYHISWLSSNGIGTVVSAWGSTINEGFPAQGQAPMALSTSVAIANDQLPLIWQVPNQAPLNFGNTMAAGGDVTMIPSVVGQTIYLFVVLPSVDAAVAGDSILAMHATALQNPQFWQMRINALPLPAMDFGGASTFGLGAGLDWHNYTAGAVVFRGAVAYSQG
jgi:hypothetical protein